MWTMWRGKRLSTTGLLRRVPVKAACSSFLLAGLIVAVVSAVGNNSDAQTALRSTSLRSHSVQLSEDVKLEWDVKNMSAGMASQLTVEFRLTVVSVDTPENYYYALVSHIRTPSTK